MISPNHLLTSNTRSIQPCWKIHRLSSLFLKKCLFNLLKIEQNDWETWFSFKPSSTFHWQQNGCHNRHIAATTLQHLCHTRAHQKSLKGGLFKNSKIWAFSSFLERLVCVKVCLLRMICCIHSVRSDIIFTTKSINLLYDAWYSMNPWKSKTLIQKIRSCKVIDNAQKSR